MARNIGTSSRRARRGGGAPAAGGNSIRTISPPPDRSRRRKTAPCASVTALTMASPSPLPMIPVPELPRPKRWSTRPFRHRGFRDHGQRRRSGSPHRWASRPTHRDVSAVPAVLDRVIQKVGHRFVQADRVARDECLFHRVIDFQPDKDFLANWGGRAGPHVPAGLPDRRFRLQGFAAVDHHGMAEQLVGELARLDGIAVDAPDRFPQAFRIVLVGGQFGLEPRLARGVRI